MGQERLETATLSRVRKKFIGDQSVFYYGAFSSKITMLVEDYVAVRTYRATLNLGGNAC